jgi:hypothetical protein
MGDRRVQHKQSGMFDPATAFKVNPGGFSLRLSTALSTNTETPKTTASRTDGPSR